LAGDAILDSIKEPINFFTLTSGSSLNLIDGEGEEEVGFEEAGKWWPMCVANVFIGVNNC